MRVEPVTSVLWEWALKGLWLGKANIQIHLFSLNQRINITDLATVKASNFQLDRKTRFVIHGFIDDGDSGWPTDVCKVGAHPPHLVRQTPPADRVKHCRPEGWERVTFRERQVLPKTTEENSDSQGHPLQVLPTHQPLAKHLLIMLKRPRVQSENPRGGDDSQLPGICL